ncbi:MAG: LysM peptidoglycan-binding domain-containing protein [Bacteroidales bacterium]|jgi:membrane-bound lytic murein transglycosylase D|nr:LysM peptidoglycan-binding domain-containing protein [Bacteroidales bacterium]
MKFFHSVLFVIFSFSAVFAQHHSALSETLPADTIVFNTINTNLDNLVNSFYVRQSQYWKYANRSVGRMAADVVPEFTAEVYKKRIAKIPTVIPLSYNDQVQSYINVYAFKRRNQVEIMMGLAEYYFPLFEEILEQNNVPQELKYLAVIESALNPRATSPVGAAGLWQFMPATGKIYNLEINSYIDDRRDPMKSTAAAAKYLGTLYKMFDDWLLAIAAYNCGPGNVRKAIVRSGGKGNFWEVYNHLPKETRGYVPAYIAAYYVFEHHVEHNLWAREIQLPPAIDTIHIAQRINLQQISGVLNVPLQQLQDMNPHCRTGIFPHTDKVHALYLPVEYVSPFLQLQDSIFAYNDSLHFNDSKLTQAPSISTANVSSGGKTTVYYYVKKGDNLGMIAKWYNVNANDIKSWNKLKSTALAVNQKLTIQVPAEYKDYYSKITSMSLAQKQKLTQPTQKQRNAGYVAQSSTPKPVATQNTASQNSVSQSDSSNAIAANTTKPAQSQQMPSVAPASGKTTVLYAVQKGDNLGLIAQWYNVGVADLKSWNNLKSTSLMVGQKLKVQVPAEYKDYYTKIATMTLAQKQKLTQPTVKQQNTTAVAQTAEPSKTPPTANNQTSIQQEGNNSFVYHTVAAGETLYSISKKYDNVTVDSLMALNNLTSNSLKIGVRLKVKQI